jgi:hypothetical protein
LKEVIPLLGLENEKNASLKVNTQYPFLSDISSNIITPPELKD